MSGSKSSSRFKKVCLERTGCFGSCPIYTVEIHSDGSVRYFGRMFVEKTGPHEWIIDEVAVDAINAVIRKYGYFSIEAGEDLMITTDMPSCITSVLLEDGSSKEIDNYHGSSAYPKILQRFENRIDEITGTRKYVGRD